MGISRRYVVVAAIVFASVPAAFATAGARDEVASACPDAVEPAAAPVDAFQAALAGYASVPGFVDLIADPGDPHAFVALFDLAYAPAPLPAATTVGDLTIRAVGDRFKPLIAEAALDPPLIPGACSNRISPGVAISTPVGGCSLNFIFTAAGKTYAGTAGHCFSALGQRMTVSGIGQVGTLVYFTSLGIGNDFALVEIDANRVALVNPAMCHWGGPTSAADAAGASLVRHYGFGVGWGFTQFTRPRTGQGFDFSNGIAFSFHGLAASGDSGSGARLEAGPGLGIITHVNVGTAFVGHSAPFVFGTKVSRAMTLAEAATGLDLSLATAPVA